MGDEPDLKGFFGECGTVTRVKWLEKDGQFTGNAFVDFGSIEEATKAVAKNSESLKERQLRINFAKPRANPEGGGKGGKGGKGNLPYSIDDNKMYEFFKDSAEVVSTRWLNDRDTGEFKGIGFVTFGSTEDVDKAVAKAGEYLDGRQIRIDYAGAKKKEGAWGGGGGKRWLGLLFDAAADKSSH